MVKVSVRLGLVLGLELVLGLGTVAIRPHPPLLTCTNTFHLFSFF